MTQDQTIQRALRILDARMRTGEPLSSPAAVRTYLRLKLAGLEHEVFVTIFVDAQNRVIQVEEMFRGTLTQTSVYPREVVKASLRHNAAGVFFAHNHPSGISEPSHADERSGPKKSDSRISEVSALIDGESRMKRSKTDETTPPQPRSGLQGESGAERAQG
jgi:DNA repair protein RadC